MNEMEYFNEIQKEASENISNILAYDRQRNIAKEVSRFLSDNF